MKSDLRNALDNLLTAYKGYSIKTNVENVIAQTYSAAGNGDFSARYLNGVYVGDFLTRQNLYDYMTSGNYIAHTMDKSDRTSDKPMSVLCYETYFGNATDLYNRFNTEYLK